MIIGRFLSKTLVGEAPCTANDSRSYDHFTLAYLHLVSTPS